MNESLLSAAARNEPARLLAYHVGVGLGALASAPLRAATRKPAVTVGLAIGTYGLKDLTTPDALRLIKETGYDECSSR